MKLEVLLYENRQLIDSAEFDDAVWLGRQRSHEEILHARLRERESHGGKEREVHRWIIARRDESSIGRKQLRIEPLPDGSVRLYNGSNQPLRFLDQAPLERDAERDSPLPVIVVLGQTRTLRIQRLVPGKMQSLADVTAPPRGQSLPVSRLPSLVSSPGGAVPAQELITWLNAVLDVLNAAADSPDFFPRAARAVVDTVALDSARVILYLDGRWQQKTVQVAGQDDTAEIRPFSHSILERMREQRKPTWEHPGPESSPAISLQGVQTVVAAPILDCKGEVIGALYGERRQKPRAGSEPFGRLDAMLVEVLARGVASGLARLEEERGRIAARVQLEQYFTPELAREMLTNQRMLEGHDREVTVMFCDIRGFSRISEKIGAGQTIEWCRDVLDVLSHCVLEQGGVVIDYIGDGLMAMWGAPGEQSDHAQRACQAALDMLERLPGLNQIWEVRIGQPVLVGIGINTGRAQVGNVGSRRKFKYGAMGHTVNLASRVQGATKFFKCSVLLTETTHEQVRDCWPLRKLGRVKVVGLDHETDLYQLFHRDWDQAAAAVREYEQALSLFEAGKFADSARTLAEWRKICPDDDPVLILMYRAIGALVEGRPEGHPVWSLTAK